MSMPQINFKELTLLKLLNSALILEIGIIVQYKIVLCALQIKLYPRSSLKSLICLMKRKKFRNGLEKTTKIFCKSNWVFCKSNSNFG